ncbi:MAG: glycine--tRNA ligase subunit beta [Acidobacteria bacterium]|nr:glycine--tRNA ligase subunit beta [Acidobacteriota bacterium]MBS1866961.1 glycine--tRNA ligase subunit beta [Acidobacteriota bacterium]
MKRSVKKAEERRAELLLEIGCEEIPAGMLPRAEEELRSGIEKLLTAENMADCVSVETYSAPRRLTAWVRGLRTKQADLVSEVTGPPKSVAYDAVGAPTRAAVSFAEKQGVALHDVYCIQTQKGEYLAAKQIKRGRSTEQILLDILPRVIHDIYWPKTMTWTGLSGARFIRPVRWLVGIFDGKPLKFKFAELTGGTETAGHRFLGASRIRVKSFADYEKKLRANGVIVRASARREKVEKELAALAKKGSYKVHEDAELLKLVSYLSEYPTVIEGKFDPAFLSLPDEILITVMRGHQKYFAVEKRGGDLAPNFLAVINLDKDPKGLTRVGHEKVLRARFADARFFWESDQKCRLADYLPKLERVTYESRLGSYKDKVERMRAIARWLAEQWFNLGLVQAHVAEADRATELAKCDLATEMVREFTELQGVVGGLYAKSQGEPEEVADAIYDHYLPVGLDDPVPRNLTGCAVAIADKLDSVAGCFAVGVVPSGSSDPFALRRAALGIVKIVLEKKLPLSLSLAVSQALKVLLTHAPKKSVTPEQEAQILDFLRDRARYVFREKDGFEYDEVNAVFRAGADDLVDARKRLEALRAIRKSKNFEPLTVSFKRIRKILEKAGKQAEGVHIQTDLFEGDAERTLFASMRKAGPKVEEQKRAGHYKEALEVIASLRPEVDRFFEQVMVMAENEAVKKNRLALLSELLREFSTIADFSELGGEGKN